MCNWVFYTCSVFPKSFLYYRQGGAETDSLGAFYSFTWSFTFHTCSAMTLTSLRREAQQVCLIFHTTAATRSNDRKQLEQKKGNKIKREIFHCASAVRKQAREYLDWLVCKKNKNIKILIYMLHSCSCSATASRSPYG